MSYLLLDDGFGDHPKIEALSDAAFRAHVRALCYAKRHPSGGTLPSGSEHGICRGKAKRCVAELVRAGLWEPRQDGWQIHDWADWWNDDEATAAEIKAEQDEKRRALAAKRAEAGRKGGKKSAESRAEANGTAQPKGGAEAKPKQSTEARPSKPEALASKQTEANGQTNPEAKPSRTDARPTKAKAKGSSPKAENTAAKDLTGSARGQQQPIPCPPDLDLTPEQKATTASAMVPAWAVTLLVQKFRSKHVADPDDRRTLVNWRKSLASMVHGEWNDPRKRPRQPQGAPLTPDAAKAQREAKEAREAAARAEQRRRLGVGDPDATDPTEARRAVADALREVGT